MCWRLSPPPKKPPETTPALIASRSPGYDGPSFQLSNAGHHASAVGYSNWGQHASEQGTINNNISFQIHHYDRSSKPLEKLERHCSLSAAFDSAARFDPPRCAQSTRLQVLQTIAEWVDNDVDTAVPSSLFWLYGGAGVGKSAIAQSLSEEYQKKNKLAASFFFFRSDPSRNNGDLLIPTLVSHVVRPFNIVNIVDNRIHENPTLFSKIYDIQIQELLIEPLLTLKLKEIRAASHPRLIVIDGLDECQNPDVQCELLRVIGRAIRQIPYPLRFLVTSRPEAHIAQVFNHDPDLKTITVRRYNLSRDPDADMDIHHYLTREFEKIRIVHRLGRHLPHTWPDQNTIISLVERSSGHFIYASTVIRYIQSFRHRPDDRLEVILRLRPPQDGDRPYAQLDALYALIFAGAESQGQLEKVCLVLGILFFQSKNFPTVRDRTIEELLEMKPGDLELLLDPILSLVSIDGDRVRILHKSLFDYLLDSDRRGELPFDLAQVHAVAATYILKHTILEDVYDSGDFRRFAFHCKYSYPSDTLKHYLLSLEVPYPKSVGTTPKISFLWPDNENLLFSIESCFCALRRTDFDSTGQLYDQYMAKWIDFLNSSRTEHQSRVEVDDLKCKLDTLLMEWKCEDSNTMDVGMNRKSRCVDFIKQEHDVYALFAEASTAVIPSAFASVSSLVFGIHFIHGYNLLIGHKRSFLFARTYSNDRSSLHEPIQRMTMYVFDMGFTGTWTLFKK